jgi:hypothetical protein
MTKASLPSPVKIQFYLTHSVFFLQTTSGGTESLLLACKTYRDSIPLSKYSFILPTVCFFSRRQVVVLKVFLLACKTYRDWAKEEKGIIKPEM